MRRRIATAAELDSRAARKDYDAAGHGHPHEVVGLVHRGPVLREGLDAENVVFIDVVELVDNSRTVQKERVTVVERPTE